MALTTPILESQIPLNAEVDNTIGFRALGGDQFDGLIYYIYDMSNTLVYSQEITTVAAMFTIPANSMENGQFFKLTMKTRKGTTYSSPSEYALVVAYAPPSVKITNLTAVNNTYSVNNQNFTFEGQYSSSDNIELGYYYYNLNNSNGELIRTYTYNYQSSGESLLQTITGLDDGISYEIELVCVDKYGKRFSSGEIEFTVNYVTPRMAEVCNLTNNCKQASVTINCSLKQISFKTVNNGTPVYSNNMINATSTNGVYLPSADISHDFSLQIWGKNLQYTTENNPFCLITNGDDYIRVWYDTTNGRIKAKKGFAGHVMPYTSDYIGANLSANNFYILIKQRLGRIDLFGKAI